MSCCDYNAVFNLKRAREELQDYQTQGPKKSSMPLVTELRKLPLEGQRLLDIGGGVGALVFELFKEGVEQATHVELAPAFSETFRHEADRQGIGEQVKSLRGDFLSVRTQVEPADLVTLDKVICCYPNYIDLVQASSAMARHWYAYVIPRDVWWVRLGDWLEEKVNNLRRVPVFPTFFHPTDDIERLLTESGFRKIAERRQREWLTVVFERGA